MSHRHDLLFLGGLTVLQAFRSAQSPLPSACHAELDISHRLIKRPGLSRLLVSGEMMMPQTIWLPDIFSGVPAMDNLHHNFFAALTELALVDDRDFCGNYMRFVGKIERIFQQEAAWMDEIDFPLFREHQEQHARVLSALHHVLPRIMDGELALGRKVTEDLLPQWLAFHMATMDTALALALQMHQVKSVPRNFADSSNSAPSITM